MIDRDGIKRPSSYDEHEIHMPSKKKQIVISEKIYFPKNIFYKLYAFILRYIIFFVLYPFLKIRYRLKVKGRKNLRDLKEKPAIIIANHASTLDYPSFQVCASPGRKVWFVSLMSNLEIPIAGKIVKAVGCLPVPEKINDMKYFFSAINKLVEKKKLIYIMPEASLWPHYRDLRPFKEGAFKIAVKNNLPVIPVTFTFKLKTKRKKNGTLKRKYKMDLTIHKYIEADKTIEQNSDKIKELSDRTWNLMNDFIQSENYKNDKKYKPEKE